MTERKEVKRRRRRSSSEIQRLVAEFRASGLRQSEFCRIHGLTHGTLQRGLRRERMGSGSQSEVKGLVAVELTDGEASAGWRFPAEAVELLTVDTNDIAEIAVPPEDGAKYFVEF